MESTGEAGKVQCSSATAALLLNSGRHTLCRRGIIAVKGKGAVETFWLTGRHGRTRSRPRSLDEGRCEEQQSRRNSDRLCHSDDRRSSKKSSISMRESSNEVASWAACAAGNLVHIVAAERGNLLETDGPVLVEDRAPGVLSIKKMSLEDAVAIDVRSAKCDGDGKDRLHG